MDFTLEQLAVSSRWPLPDTVTHTALGMLTAFLDDATGRNAPSASPNRRPGRRRIEPGG